MDGQGPDDGADAAERAFEALRAEVTAQRGVLERVAAALKAQGQRSEPLAPDYSPTLGSMAKSLQALQARLAAIEDKPALAMTPELYWQRFEAAGQSIGKAAERELRDGAAAQRDAARQLRELLGSARSAGKQRDWLIGAGALGVVGGLLLFVMLVSFLPFGMGTWLASVPLSGGDRWQAGQGLMRDEDPAAWGRMAQLYNACTGQTTEICVAAMKAQSPAPATR